MSVEIKTYSQIQMGLSLLIVLFTCLVSSGGMCQIEEIQFLELSHLKNLSLSLIFMLIN